ncbi:flagellar hook-length control protein FliK [Halomonas saccharevitans]|uniref:Flagellar hook-length control protein FliK n=1 Tax=Halomonas saccharevitans TaxID=416872 RepID=A0ABU3NDA9_9GAMM|nr:flagellar hook-length control protein FliK [Halomonas saccharevitans]MDT8879175.1 flagellar hook-length control protein FliK [Halomonas saccharevitans]
MSGITPLLDTLLHQVLGKRVDTQPPQDLNQPVKPTSPAEAPKALHSDSRLDARNPSAPLPGLGRTQGATSESATRPLSDAGQSPASTQTHFSRSALTIADLLMRFPAPPSSVRPPTPLMMPGQAPDPANVAVRLEDSIRHSGLFYESHLARWFKGEMPRQQLEREPQMWRALQFTLSGTRQGDAAPSGPAGPRDLPFLPGAPLPRGAGSAPLVLPAGAPPASASSQHPTSTMSPLPAAAPATPTPSVAGIEQGGTAAARESLTEALPRPPANAPVQESLQGIVRHQLEMLVTPTLRWEGDVWSGLFMALMVPLPPGHQERQGSEESESQRRDGEQRGWRSEIDLEITGLGRLKASLWMEADRVEIDLRLAQESTRQRLESGLDHLRSRLAGHGFETIQIDLGRLDEGPTP